MQRVLSFQTARGFGESAEFVTKRMCFSFLFSIGFLCILCGFLIGRFAAQRAVDIRTEREQKLVAGNGLESGEQLLQRIIEQLGQKGFDGATDLIKFPGGDALANVKDTFAALDLFSEISINGTCLTASITGTHERDRYVVITLGGQENINVLLEIVEELHKVTGDIEWKPRRTLIFLLYEESMDDCLAALSDYKKSKIVALLTIGNTSIAGDGQFVCSGSDIVQTTALESLKAYAGLNTEYIALPRLKLNIPHSVLSFVNYANITSLSSSRDQRQIVPHRKILAKILTTSFWKLSQMNIFQWDPRLIHDSMRSVLSKFTSPDLHPYIQRIKEKLSSITEYGSILNDRIGNVDGMKPLEVRMLNDLMKDVEKALLCSDGSSQSRTDIALLNNLLNNQEVTSFFDEMVSCFDTAIRILQDMT